MLLRESFVGVFVGWSVGINMMGKMYCSGVYVLIKSDNEIHVFAGWSGGINVMGRMSCSGVYIVIKSHNKIHANAR